MAANIPQVRASRTDFFGLPSILISLLRPVDRVFTPFPGASSSNRPATCGSAKNRAFFPGGKSKLESGLAASREIRTGKWTCRFAAAVAALHGRRRPAALYCGDAEARAFSYIVWPLLTAKERRDRKDVCFLLFFRGYSFIQFALILATDGGFEPRCSGPIPLRSLQRLNVPVHERHVAALVVTEVRPAPVRVCL